MKLLAAISTTTLFLLLGTTAAAYAPQDRQEQPDKSEKQDEKAKPEKKESPAKPAKQEQANKPVKQETKQASQEKRGEPANDEPKRAKQEQKDEPTKHEAKQAKQDERVRQQDQQSAQRSRNDGDRGGGGHGRISDEHYRASFGSGHNFHVNRGDYDHRRFNYGGYSFGFIDPWPEGWFYTDNVYIVYEEGGYYMYDAIHPGMRISVNIL
jgi:hypothetical protein